MGKAGEKCIVSACLAGAPCRYDGTARPDSGIVSLVRGEAAWPACPECMAGLAPGRPPAEIVGGSGEDVLDGKARVLDTEGRDLTDRFVAGAERFVRLAERIGAKSAILKSKSPSCGVCAVFDGTFAGRLRPGAGVTAALCVRRGITVREI